MPTTPSPTATERWAGGRVAIGLRWWITRSGALRTGWPAPGLEADALAMGWVAERSAVGVIEWPAPPIDPGLLDALHARYPGRRWFAGDWAAGEWAGQADEGRRAA